MDKNLNQTVTIANQNQQITPTVKKVNMNDEGIFRMYSNSVTNYNMLVNNMLISCSERCLSSFKIEKLTRTENTCVDFCSKNYMRSVNIGINVVNSFLMEEAKVKKIN